MCMTAKSLTFREPINDCIPATWSRWRSSIHRSRGAPRRSGTSLAATAPLNTDSKMVSVWTSSN